MLLDLSPCMFVGVALVRQVALLLRLLGGDVFVRGHFDCRGHQVRPHNADHRGRSWPRLD